MADSHVQILMIEDDPDMVGLLKQALTADPEFVCQVTPAMRLDEARKQLSGKSFDVILCDLSLPDSTGLDTFQKVRDAAPATPIVILTATDDEKTALSAVEKGAQDFLMKTQADVFHLVRAIRYAISRKKAG